jgi:hypothetical protein
MMSSSTHLHLGESLFANGVENSTTVFDLGPWSTGDNK